jgi:hypothetical protein
VSEKQEKEDPVYPWRRIRKVVMRMRGNPYASTVLFLKITSPTFTACKKHRSLLQSIASLRNSSSASHSSRAQHGNLGVCTITYYTPPDFFETDKARHTCFVSSPTRYGLKKGRSLFMRLDGWLAPPYRSIAPEYRQTDYQRTSPEFRTFPWPNARPSLPSHHPLPNVGP